MSRIVVKIVCIVYLAAQMPHTFAGALPERDIVWAEQTIEPIRLAQLQDNVIDLDPPQVDHVPTSAGVAGTSQSISVRAVDVQGIDSVTLMHRADAASEYESVLMRRVAGSDNFVATIGSGSEQKVMEYYFLVIDTGGNKVLSGFPYEPFSRTLVPPPSDASLASSGATTDAVQPAQTSGSSKGAGVAPAGSDSRSNAAKVAWAVLGLVVVGALVSAGGDGNSSAASTETVPVIFDIPPPQ